MENIYRYCPYCGGTGKMKGYCACLKCGNTQHVGYIRKDDGIWKIINTTG